MENVNNEVRFKLQVVFTILALEMITQKKLMDLCGKTNMKIHAMQNYFPAIILWVTLNHGVPQWGTPLVYLLVYPYILVFGQVSETF